ncbi:Hypothetical protein A7982_07511 [Minicystis rosea]|nr:Hypothetical protein A7982_07511 [Minicystis rosea]
MDVPRPALSDAEDDVNVKSTYVNCWFRAPEPRALSKTPDVPPLALAQEPR